MEISKQSPGEAWLCAIKLIIGNGTNILDDTQKLREITNLIIRIQKPLIRDEKIEALIQKEHFTQVFDATLSNIPIPGYAYSYGERISNYKGTNQLDWVISKLKSNPDTKSATIGILMPDEDTKKNGKMPCMNLLDFKIREKRLNCTVVFRSHDYGRRALPNLLAVAKLMEKIAHEVKVPLGELICHSISAHIYENELQFLKKRLGVVKTDF